MICSLRNPTKLKIHAAQHLTEKNVLMKTLIPILETTDFLLSLSDFAV